MTTHPKKSFVICYSNAEQEDNNENKCKIQCYLLHFLLVNESFFSHLKLHMSRIHSLLGIVGYLRDLISEPILHAVCHKAFVCAINTDWR